MGVGMGSKNQRSSGVFVVSCVVLGLALLIVGSEAGKDIRQCVEECRGKWDRSGCMIGCINDVMLLTAHGGTGGEEASGGGAGVGLSVEGAGRGGEEKMKQEDVAVHWAYHAPSPAQCYVLCYHKKEPFHICYKRCMESMHLAAHGGTEREEAAGAGIGLLAESAGREEEEGKRKQEVAGVHWAYHAPSPAQCYVLCYHKKEPFHICYKRCMESMHLAAHGGTEREAAGAGFGLQAEGAGWEEEEVEEEEEGKRNQEVAAVARLTHDTSYCIQVCKVVPAYDFTTCFAECRFGRVAHGKDARAGGEGVGLLAAPVDGKKEKRSGS